MSKIAIIATGGKQYVVSKDSVVEVEKLDDSHKAGDKVVFDTVLLVDDGNDVKVGTPHVSGAKVTGEVVETGRGDKVVVIKYRQKSRYFKKKGHRQPYTKVKITALS
jgi:large subunit ribosomal protein L21